MYLNIVANPGCGAAMASYLYVLPCLGKPDLTTEHTYKPSAYQAGIHAAHVKESEINFILMN